MYVYRKFSIEPPRWVYFSSTLEGAYWREVLNKFFKYGQIFYGDIICTFQESSPIALSSLQ